jgi:hypothetical protein
MLTIEELIAVMEHNQAAGLNPFDNGSCFGVSDPARLRQIDEIVVPKQTKEEKKDGHTRENNPRIG